MPALAAPSGLVIGVFGASGGLGASTLTTALAVSAARDPGPSGFVPAGFVPAVAVDGVLAGGGLDVTACVEHVPGLRWPDIAGARGEVSGVDLVAALPPVAGARLLSAAVEGPTPARQVVASVMSSLRSVAGVVVVDLPRAGAEPDSAEESLLSACDVVLLLAGVTPRQLSDAVAARARLASAASGGASGAVGLVVRGARAGDLPSAMADHLDLPLASCWRNDGRVALDGERGRTPGESQRSSTAAVCRGLLEWVAGVDDRRAA